MSFRFGAQILQDSHIVLVNLANQVSKVHNLGTEALNFIYPLSQDKILLTVDEQKFLNAYSVTEDLSTEFKARLKLSKKLTHGWVAGERFYYWDKFGDIYSLKLEDLYNAPEFKEVTEGENFILDKSFLTQESGNFSTLTSFNLLKLNLTGQVQQYVALSDEYYKIRLFEFPNLHVLTTNLAFRKRFVNYIFEVNEDSLLALFDDNKFFRIPKECLLSSDSTDVVEVTISEQFQALIDRKKLEFLELRENSTAIFKIGDS